MRRIVLLLVLLASACPLCQGAGSVLEWKVENVEMHQTDTDSISVDIFVNVTREKIKKKSAVVLQGFLLVGNETIPLKAASFYTFDRDGKKYNVRKGYSTASGYGDEMFFASGQSVSRFTMHSLIPMPQGIDACSVLMIQTERWADKQQVVSAVEVAHFYHKPRPVVKPRFYYLPAPDDRAELRTFRSEVRPVFPNDKDTYDNKAAMNSKTVFDFIQEVSAVISNPRTWVSSISFNGYAGIEGSEKANRARCKARAESIMKYLNGKKAFGTSKVDVNVVGEDWASVNAWIDDSFWGRDEEYRSLIGRTSDNDTRERAIREQYPDLWDALVKRVLPGLERYECVVTYRVDPFEDDDALQSAFDKSPWQLCQSDYYRLLNNQDMYSGRWFEILDEWVSRYPYSKPALVNASAAYIACGELRKANTFLRLLGDSDDARYYKALWFFYSGDLDSAFEMSSSLDPSNPAYGSFFEQLSSYKNWKFNSFTRAREK